MTDIAAYHEQAQARLDAMAIVINLREQASKAVEQLQAAEPKDDPEDPRTPHIQWAREQIAKAVPKATEDFPRLKTLREMLTEDLPEQQWVMPGILMDEAVTAIAAQPKSTKTWLGLEMLLCVAGCPDAIGGKFRRAHAPRHVVVFCAEDHQAEVRRRLFVMLKGRGMTNDEIFAPGGVIDRVHVLPRRRLDLCDEASMVNFVAMIHMDCPELPGAIMLDPLIDVARVEDENKATEMKKAADRFRLLRDIFHCAVVFVHHNVKESGTGPVRRVGQRMRGSGALHGAVDCTIDIGNVNDVEHTCDVNIQTRSGGAAKPFGMKLHIEDDATERAISATWETGDPGSFAGAAKAAAAAQRDDDLEGKVLAVFRSAADARDLEPISKRALFAAVGGNKSAVFAAVDSLHRQGAISQCGTRGYRAGL